MIDLLGKRHSETEIISDTEFLQQEISLYFKSLAFYIGVSYIAEIFSKCKIKVYDRGIDSDKTSENSSDVNYKLMSYKFNFRPNPNENAVEFKRNLIFKMFYENEAVVFMHKNNFYIADSYTIDYKPVNGNIYNDISLNGTADAFTRSAENIFIFRLDDKSVQRLVNGMLEEYNSIFQTALTSFRKNNGTKYKYTASAPEVGDSDFAKKNKENQTRKLKSFIENPNAVFFAYKGQDISQISNLTKSGEDIQKIRKDMFELAAQALKMPVTMLYGNVTNYKDVINGWASVTVEPLAKLVETELTIKSIPENEVMSGSRYMIDTTMLTHLDFFDMCEKAQHAIGNGTHNIDDVREKMGDNKLNTSFSQQHWLSKNYDKIENMLNSVDNQQS